MSPQRKKPNQNLQVLLIEDNEDDVLFIQENLAGKNEDAFDLECAKRLSEGLACLAEKKVDVVLLDLGLPDSQGLDTFNKAHAQAPDVPFIVLSGLDDKEVAVKALQKGAQDYLVKGQVDSYLLVRSIGYAIERQHLQVELQQAKQRKQQDRELHSFERFAATPGTTFTAQSFGLKPLQAGMPDIFDELVQKYGDLVSLAVEQQAYKVEHNIPENLRAIAGQLGFLNAGPRDVVDIHSTALKRKGSGLTSLKIQAYMEEGRLLVLELMGYLVSYYRNYALGFGQSAKRSQNVME